MPLWFLLEPFFLLIWIWKKNAFWAWIGKGTKACSQKDTCIQHKLYIPNLVLKRISFLFFSSRHEIPKIKLADALEPPWLNNTKVEGYTWIVRKTIVKPHAKYNGTTTDFSTVNIFREGPTLTVIPKQICEVWVSKRCYRKIQKNVLLSH